MKNFNRIGASTLAASEGNLVMTLWPNVLRRAVRWGSSAVGIACLMITTAAGAGESWETLASGTGVNGPVRAVTTFGGDLIVGGQFAMAGSIAGTPGIARWDGQNWWALGSGTQNSVLALTTFNGELIAGGLFTSASGVPGTSYVAKWNGSIWLPLGTGLNGEVYSLATFDDDGAGPHAPALYAAGAFTKAGGTTVNHIAKWNGSAWSALGSGLNNTVMSLATFDDLSGSGPELYVGGYFSAAMNGPTAVEIARWNGAWSAVGSGMVTTSGDAVFALWPDTRGALLWAGGYCEVSPHTVGVAGYLMRYHFVP